MLNNRQQAMIGDLESGTELITAKFLSQKYGVSLRTIRSDVQVISDYLEGKQANFVKIPGKGMRIVSYGSVSQMIEEDMTPYSMSSYHDNDRKKLIAIYFLIQKNPLTSSFLAQSLGLSRNTVINTLDEINRELNSIHLKLIGKKNHGYILDGEEINMIALINRLVPTLKEVRYYHLFQDADQGLLSKDDLKDIGKILDYISETLQWPAMNENLMRIWMTFFISRLRYGKKITLNRNLLGESTYLERDQKFERLCLEIQSVFGVMPDRGQKAFLSYILNDRVRWTEEGKAEWRQDDISRGVQAMIDRVASYFPSVCENTELLKNDLVSHIQSNLARYQLMLPTVNPLLEQTKMMYGDVFSVVKKCAGVLTDTCGIVLDDDDIGFLTLHFCRNLEQSRHTLESRILVVCNTGQGASKLLAKRLENNLPSIHVSGVMSANDAGLWLESNDVDLVLSTIPLPELKRPVMVVSSIITETELAKVREALFLGKRKNVSLENNFKPALDTLISKYVAPKDADEFQQKMGNLVQFLSNQKMTGEEEQQADLYADITVEVANTMRLLFPAGLSPEQFSKVVGVMVHCQMSVSRWQNGRFIPNDDYQMYREKYPEKIRLIEQLLKNIAQKLNVFIDPGEATAIIRYIV
ncbi:PRD domain-containing protein [Caproiciproducens sp.]